MPVLPGTPPVDVVLRRSARARRFSLRVSSLDGGVTLSMPLRTREAEALGFLAAQEGWIRAALSRMPPVTQVAIGTALPLEGRMLTLMPAAGRAVRIEGAALLVPGDEGQAARRVRSFALALARDRLAAACDRHARGVGRPFASLVLRDTRSRWGSCTSDGALMYSWRLIMAPPRVLDYVAAHEVAHMQEMKHSERFWAVVQRLFPGWQTERAWLKREGGTLQAIRFDSDAPDEA